jgi:manganese transport protein
MIDFLRSFFRRDTWSPEGARKFFQYLGPGLLVTVGFIDPGNWAANIATGAQYGYSLLWVVTLSTVMLILLQHTAAHLGIATGLCLAEAAEKYLRPAAARTTLCTALLAAMATALAEILGSAIALNMLFRIPVKLGAVLGAVLAAALLYSNSYRRLEKWIIGFVSLIGLSFLYEISQVQISWGQAAAGWVVPRMPEGSMVLVMSVLGAIVMPHNLFLHSEIIQSRQWNLEDESKIRRQLRYEFLDTLFSMLAGWAINSAMVLLAAAAFFAARIPVTELSQAQNLLQPLVGSRAAVIFALALLFAGISSSVTAAMAGGSVASGFFGEPYNIKDRHTRLGIGITLGGALAAIFFIPDTFKGLIYSQMGLSLQLPVTVFLLVYLTSSKKVMGKYANGNGLKTMLLAIAALVAGLNIKLLIDLAR